MSSAAGEGTTWTRKAIAGIVTSVIGDTVLEIVFQVSLVMGTIFDQLNGALLQAGSAAGSPFQTGGSGLLGLLAELNSWVVDFAAGSGALAPVVAVLIWSLGIAAAGYGIMLLMEALKWLT